MAKSLAIVVLAFMGVFVIDQNLKVIFLEGFRWYGDFFSLILTFNKGVAFSFFAFLEEDLKYIQSALIAALTIYLLIEKKLLQRYSLAIGIILGAGSSNLYDRFVYGGVVDYFYWHKWFEFAVFNFADVMINIGVLIILVITYLDSKRVATDKNI